MNFINMVYFLAVAQERSFKNAAQKLYLSQQTLSENIKRLEDEVGLPLFIRSRPLTLTEAGEHFAASAEEIMSAKNRLESDLFAISGKKEKQITLVAPQYGPPPFVPDLIAAFLSKELECSVDLRKYPPGISLRPYLESDFLFLPVPNQTKDMLIKTRPISHKVAIVNRSLLQRTWGAQYSNQCQKLRETESLTDLVTIPFIQFYETKQQLEDAFQLINKYSYGPPIASLSGNSEVCLAMCFAGMGGILASVDWIRKELQRLPKSKTDELEIFKIQNIAIYI